MIILDTHVLVWWLGEPSKLSKKAEKVIISEKDQGKLFISSISIWEICLLVKKGRMGLGMDIDSWLTKLDSLSFLESIPLSNTILAKSVYLPEPFHNDPGDRIIIATARESGATLITSDSKIQKYPHVQTLW